MIITITFTDGLKDKFSDIIELYQPNNTDKIIILDNTGVRTEVNRIMIKKIEVKP